MSNATQNPSHAVLGAVRHFDAHGGHADGRSVLARSGLVAKGVLYSVLGLLSLQVASGDASSDRATTRGAIELVLAQPLGHVLLALLTIGLIALALWQCVLAVTGDPVEGNETKDRVLFAIKALIYGGTAATALTLLLPRWTNGIPSGGDGSEASQERATAMIMNWPGGRWIVGAIACIVIGFAVNQLIKHAWRHAFMDRLNRSRMSVSLARAVERAGRAGYAARAIIFITVGVFLVVAALQHDPREAVGLSGAMRTIAQQQWGKALLWFVAVGLFLYGCFCFAEARFRRAA